VTLIASSELKATGIVTANGSRVWLIESTAMALVESTLLKRIGAGACAVL
jgi:hypothetical protein